EIGADQFVTYPLLLMNNVGLSKKIDEYGLVAVPDPDPASEGSLVVRTREIDAEAYDEGLRYLYSVYALHGLRGLRSLAPYLAATGQLSFVALFRAFTEHARARPDDPFTRFRERSVETLALQQFTNLGELAHLMMHSERARFDQLLVDFAK